MPTYRPQLALPPLSATVKRLIITLLCAYVAQLVLQNWMDVPVVPLLALSPGGFAIWQLVTFVLVDIGNPMMFLIGLLFIWWALSPFERSFGPVRVLQLCLCSVLGASLPAELAGFALPGSPLLYGSTPLWFGGIAATTWLYRDQQLSLFGVVSMGARQFLWLLVGMSVLGFLATKNHTQLIADLGSMAAAIGFVQWLGRPRRKPRTRKPPARSSGFKVIRGGGSGDDDGRPKWLN